MNYLASNGYHTLSADQLVEALVTGKQLPPKSIVVTLDDGYEDNYLYALPILHKYHIVANYMIPTGLVGTHTGNNTYITWAQLHELVNDPLIHIYNHTVDHVDVGNSSKEVDEKEIGGAKQALAQRLGVTSPIFTYPYGTTSDIAREVLREQGYVAAFTTQPGTHQCRSQLLDLHRDHVGNLPLSAYGL
jgi:peptidoglycan/xylan/chitin deacetylase (PgdA/CDA1 family)